MRIRSFILMCLVAVTMSQSVLACSCMSRGEACEAAWRVQAVFSGTVTAILPSPKLDKLVRLRVTERFRGISNDKIVWILTPASGASCGFPFERGRSYLIYAWKSDSYFASFETNICSRTWPLEHAKADVDYLRSIPTQPATTEVHGDVKQYTFDENFVPKAELSIMDHYSPPEEDVYSIAPFRDFDVMIQSLQGPEVGQTKYHSKTNSRGEYKLSGIPPGVYRVTVATPKGFVAMHASQVIAYSHGCGTAFFRTVSDGRISGRIIDSSGHPIEGLMVYIIRAKEADQAVDPFRHEMTNGNGEFKFEEMPVGQFLLGVNIAKSVWIETNKQYERAFYPSGSISREAKLIDLKLGEKKDGLILQLTRKR